MKKIMFHLNNLEKGGAERVVSILADNFAKKGYEVLIATEEYGHDEYQIADKIKRIDVGIDSTKSVNRIKNYVKRIINLRKAIKREKPDVVIAFAKKAIYRALMASMGIHTSVVISVRTNPIGFYDGIVDKLQIALLFKKVTGAVFQTRQAMEFFPKSLQRKSVVILNPIHEKYIVQRENELRNKEIVQVARLDNNKNQVMLLEAMYLVHKRYPDYILKIYGIDSHDGTKELLEQSINQNSAQKYVKLMGNSDEIEKEIKDSAVFVLSSQVEGLPNALMEAMALGLPVVATDCPCGGPATLIENGVNGLLVPVNDKKALAEAIMKLIEDEELAKKCGIEARKIIDKANQKIIFEEWETIVNGSSN